MRIIDKRSQPDPVDPAASTLTESDGVAAPSEDDTQPHEDGSQAAGPVVRGGRGVYSLSVHLKCVHCGKSNVIPNNNLISRVLMSALHDEPMRLRHRCGACNKQGEYWLSDQTLIAPVPVPIPMMPHGMMPGVPG
jgi:hypothetical protein